MKVNFEEIRTEELEELIAEIKAELESRKRSKKFYLETLGGIDPRKNGHAYLAKLKFEDGRAERDFIDNNGRSWDNKKRSYDTSFTFTAKEGDKFEARLTDGSWKSDSKQWFKVIMDDEGDLILKRFNSLREVQKA